MKKKIEKLLIIAIYFFLFSVLFLTYHRYDYAIIESFQKDGGSKIALDPHVLEVREMVQIYKLKDFNLNGFLLNDSETIQRIVEFTYPIRLNTASKYLFLSNTPENYDIFSVGIQCIQIKQGRFVNLYEC